jgi:phosphoserine phosphatase RsbU/P
MLASVFVKTPRGASFLSLDSRGRRVLAIVLFSASFAAGFAYHFINWSSGELPSALLQVLYNVNVLFGYLLLWMLLSHYNQARPSTPAKSFWTTLIFGLGFYALGWLISTLGQPASPAVADSAALGFDLDKGIPLAAVTVFRMNVISLLEIAFAILLLLRLRDLVLFKRSKSSERNWYLMLGFMILAAVSAFMKPPRTEFDFLQAFAIIPAVVLMVVNSFRLSWIVFLSFKEKIASIGLSALLLFALSNSFVRGEVSVQPGAGSYLEFYSYPLNVFAMLAIVFGILYCTTTFLSLLFHLPTTSDFRQKAGEVAAMHSLTTLVSQVFDREKLAHTIVASPVEAGLASGAWLAVRDTQSGSLRPHILATYRVAADRIQDMVDTAALYEEAVTKRQPVLLEQAAADHRINVRPGDGLGSLLVIPLTGRDAILGALFVTKEVTQGFEKDDIESACGFASQAALAMDHARLFEEQIEKERLAREIDIARSVQRKLLPQRLPCVKGVTVGASSVFAQEVGGDYFDFAELDKNRLAFIIGDVSGKGASAAFYMAELQGIFQSVSHLAPAPVEFLTHANSALGHAMEKHIFVSAIYGVLDYKNEVLSIARAGHCPAAMIGLNGEARFLRSKGLGLGLDRSPRFQQSLSEEHIRLQPGDVFVLYTDGVVESRNSAGEEFGYERLLDTVRENRHEDAPELHDALLQDLRNFIGDKPYDDDLTLVVLKWHGITLSRSRRQYAHGVDASGHTPALPRNQSELIPST